MNGPAPKFQAMNASEITVGKAVTILYKGTPLANTVITAVFDEKYGGKKFMAKGIIDEFNRPALISADDVRERTIGWYAQNPTKK